MFLLLYLAIIAAVSALLCAISLGYFTRTVPEDKTKRTLWGGVVNASGIVLMIVIALMGARIYELEDLTTARVVQGPKQVIIRDLNKQRKPLPQK